MIQLILNAQNTLTYMKRLDVCYSEGNAAHFGYHGHDGGTTIIVCFSKERNNCKCNTECIGRFYFAVDTYLSATLMKY